MIKLPETPRLIGNLARLADWVEVSSLLSPEREIWIEEIADDLRDSGLIEDEPSYPADTSQEQAELLASDILSHCEQRRRRLRENYPFAVRPQMIKAPENWQAYLCYIAL